ncbi:Uncharacterised protein [Serratia rubidaea]|uniref:Uncharacterized protein n=1 Tax=Serratia rubidaea TaxID=61652 RepID=A0A4U9HA80_SERRU|nr:Uncharacterised protein [Serratia rubidaea]
MAALATISSGLSCGRLLGPLCAALALSLHPMAPLWLMALAPLLALLVVCRQQNDPPLPPVAQQQNRLQWHMLPYLLCALLLAAAVSLMQLGIGAASDPAVPALCNGGQPPRRDPAERGGGLYAAGAVFWLCGRSVFRRRSCC